MNFAFPTWNPGCTTAFLYLLTISVVTVPVRAQNAQTQLRSSGSFNAVTIAREIDDPASGARWLLVLGGNRPGGPGQLVLVGDPNLPAPDSHLQISTSHSLVPVIRAGDAILLEEHTTAVDLELEAVALGPATIGNRLRARLRLGGRTVSAIASGPGHATLALDTKVWPQ